MALGILGATAAVLEQELLELGPVVQLGLVTTQQRQSENTDHAD